MQTISRKIIATFARVPSIKFIGPRDQVQHNTPVHTHTPTAPAAKPTSSQSKVTQTVLSNGPALQRSTDLEINLEGWQIDAINSGGVIDLKYLKVKPISLRKK
jgi:hypothetical protein